jgi:hypothetical protein
MNVHFPLSRILAALVQVGLIAFYINHDYSKWGSLGRAAFLNYQGARFDRYMGPNQSALVPVVGALFCVALAVALYEGMSALFAKMLPAEKP